MSMCGSGIRQVKKTTCFFCRIFFGKPMSFSNCESLPSRESIYPTLGKGKSSSKCHFWGDMLVPWRVLFWMFPDSSTSHFRISSASLLRVGAIDLTMLFDKNAAGQPLEMMLSNRNFQTSRGLFSVANC